MIVMLGEIFSLMSAVCLEYSNFGKSKNRMIFWQTINAGFYSLSGICLGGYSAVISSMLTLVRNVLQIKGKLAAKSVMIICVFVVVFGLYVNNRGWLGLLPVTASVIYTIMIYAVCSVKHMKIAVMINMLQWAVFDCYIGAYPSFVMDIVIIILSVVNLCIKSVHKKGLTTM